MPSATRSSDTSRVADEIDELADAKASEVARVGYASLRKAIPRTWRLWRGANFSIGDHINVEHVRGASGDALPGRGRYLLGPRSTRPHLCRCGDSRGSGPA